MLMAQVALQRADQKPRIALEHLARIAAHDRATRAIVLLNEGKAFSALGWNDRAEVAWKNALALEPRVPEAGWNLLSLYYVQGRRSLRIPWRWRSTRRSPTRAIARSCSWSSYGTMPSRWGPTRFLKPWRRS